MLIFGRVGPHFRCVLDQFDRDHRAYSPRSSARRRVPALPFLDWHHHSHSDNRRRRPFSLGARIALTLRRPFPSVDRDAFRR